MRDSCGNGESARVCCVWKSGGLKEGHVFMVGVIWNAQHMWGAKYIWKQWACCPPLQHGHPGGEEGLLCKGSASLVFVVFWSEEVEMFLLRWEGAAELWFRVLLVLQM